MELALRVAGRLGAIRGVEAVALGGSWARGDADKDSDLDLGLYYRPAASLDLHALRGLAGELDPAGGRDAVTVPREWGPWINGGAWLTIEGRRVDWLYRDLDAVESAIADCLAGRTECHYQPGHPHGFHTHIYLGEVALGRPVHDPAGVLAALKAGTVPYPPALRAAIAERYLWEARFTLAVAEKPARRGDSWYVSGALFRAVACLVQVLFALNERYFTNEKGAVAQVATLELRPRHWRSVVDGAFAGPGGESGALVGRVRALGNLVDEVAELARSAP